MKWRIQGQPHISNIMLAEFTKNRDGFVVKVVGPARAITDAGLRFASHIRTVETDFTPHRIWTASRRFRISDQLVTTPERAALILSGYEPAPGISPKVVCGMAGCVALSHLEVE